MKIHLEAPAYSATPYPRAICGARLRKTSRSPIKFAKYRCQTTCAKCCKHAGLPLPEKRKGEMS